MNRDRLSALESIGKDLSRTFTYDELYKAAHDCTKGVSWKECVTKWMADVHFNVLKLKAAIDDGSYKLLPPHVFHITDPKPRTVTAIPFRDRVLQRSMCNNGLYECLTAGLIYDNCACQKGKGVSFAIKRLKHHLHAFYREHGNKGYVVRLDIRKYFPSIPRNLLKASIRHAIPDQQVLKMVDLIIDSTDKSDVDISFNAEGFGARGINLGSQISQLLALYYLSPLDHCLKERLHVKHYIRYMDDMIMLVPTEKQAQELFKAVEGFIAKFGLKLNPKSHIRRIDQPLEFLKMIYTLTSTGKVKHRVIRKAMNKEIRTLNKQCRMFKVQRISILKLLEHTNTWFGYAKSRASRNQIHVIRDLLASNFSNYERTVL